MIDRLAGKWVAALHTLGLTGSTARLSDLPAADLDGEAHLHWVRLAELVDGYTDLITDIAEHRHCLPVF